MNKIYYILYMEELERKFNDLLVKHIYVLSSAKIRQFKRNWDKAKTDKRKQNLYDTLNDFSKYGVLSLKEVKEKKL